MYTMTAFPAAARVQVPLTSLPDSVSVLRTDNNFSYPSADLTRTAVGLSRLLVPLPGTRYLTNSKIRHMVLTVLTSSSRQSCSFLLMCPALFLKRYALYKSTFYLLIYLLTRCSQLTYRAVTSLSFYGE